MGLLVTAPGLGFALDEVEDWICFGRTGDTTTGPPSLRLIAPHCSGNRAEKLQSIRQVRLMTVYIQLTRVQ